MDVYWEISTLNIYTLLFIWLFNVVDVIHACKLPTKRQARQHTKTAQIFMTFTKYVKDQHNGFLYIKCLFLDIIVLSW
jgi:hypothetical protein